MDDLANEWLDAIDPLERLGLLTHLALEDRGIELLVFDSPDRHGIPDDDWFHYLESVATGRRAPAVVAVVQGIPANWDGPGAWAGRVQDKLAAAATETEVGSPPRQQEDGEEPSVKDSPAHFEQVPEDSAEPTTNLGPSKEPS